MFLIKTTLLTLYICCIVLIFTKDNFLIPKTIPIKDLAFLSKNPGQVYVTEIYSNIYVGGIFKFITPIYIVVIDTKFIIFGQITQKLVKTNDIF